MTDTHHPEQALAQFYQETILRHSTQPVGFRATIDATHQNEQYNPVCGDRVVMRFRVAGDLIEAAAFDGAACAICLASASMLCQHATGQHIGFVTATHDWLQGALSAKGPQQAGDAGGSAGEGKTDGQDSLQALLGVRRYPSRIQCAMLPWTAAVKALAGKV
jgi:nitrogen fixation NifU-like protein